MNYILVLPVLPFYILARYRGFAIFLLVLAISIGPRIHMGQLQYGKLLDLKLEDFLIVLLIISWFIYSLLRGQKLYISPLGKPILIYLSLAFISTSTGLFLGWIEPVRAFFFYLKEVEYLLMFFITVNFIKDIKDSTVAISAFLVGGLANGFYVLYQFLSGNVGVMGDTGIYRYYGFSMIGESGPAVTGNYFLLLFFFSATLAIFIRTTKPVKLILVICALLSIVGIVGSMSRMSIWTGVIICPIYFYLLVFRKQNKPKDIITIFAGLVLVFFTVFVTYREIKKLTPYVTRVVHTENIAGLYISGRVEEIYTDYFKVIATNPMMGLGKSITGQQHIPGVGLGCFYAEAHNQYIRLLIEMGVIGLFAFLYLMFLIMRFSYRVFKNSSVHFAQAMGLICFIYTIFLLVESLGQDAFVMTRTIELYWILVGLAMVATKWEQKKLDSYFQQKKTKNSCANTVIS